MTTTDFATGAISAVDLTTGEVHADVALASPDAIPIVHDGLLYVVNRYMYDYVSVLDPTDGFRVRSEHAITQSGGASTNPHDVAFDGAGRAYVAMYGASTVQVHDFLQPSGTPSLIASVDTSAFADGDGIAEGEAVVSMGEEIWWLSHPVNRLEQWSLAGTDQLVEIDTETFRVVDRDPTQEGVQGIALPCGWSRQLRRHPTREGHLLVLCEGIVDVDVDAGAWTWWVPPESLPHASSSDYRLHQAFAVTDDGDFTVVASYDPSYEAVTLWRVRPDAPPAPLVEGVQSVERSLEVVGEAIYFGDRSLGGAGVRVFDLDGTPMAELSGTGLPPYATTLRLSGSP